jgi:two-component sensor histidine kinase
MSDAGPPSGAGPRSRFECLSVKKTRSLFRASFAHLVEPFARPAPIALLVFIVGLAATLFAWRAVEVREDRLVHERFDNVATQLISEISRHQGVHEQSLRAGAALVSIVDGVKAANWRAIYDNLRVAQLLPGVQGYGFAEALAPEERSAHVARVREQGFPRYQIAPSGERDFYTPIAFLEPFDLRNQRAHGYDMFSDPERRAAMVRAAETGATAATGRVRLVQESDEDAQPGFLLYVPIYRTGAAKDGERLVFPGLAGFAYSPVRVRDFFNAILRSIQPDITRLAAIEVFDGAVASPEAMIFKSGDARAGVTEFMIERTHDLFGREWTLRMSPLPSFVEAVDRRARRDILIGGLAISMMAGALAWLVQQRQEQREQAALRNDMIAREMSHRVKNLLAVIQSIASRTLSGGRTLAEARSVFGDRLSALARAHSTLVDGRWSGASLRNLLEGELAPFGVRISMTGPFVLLNSQMAQSMAMAVHELATNAVKYGSLSKDEGVVRIAWNVRATPGGQTFSFSWQELGGPPASEPDRDGFGQTLLKRLVGASIGADPVTEYAQDGFRYSFECPLDRVSSPPQDDKFG